MITSSFSLCLLCWHSSFQDIILIMKNEGALDATPLTHFPMVSLLIYLSFSAAFGSRWIAKRNKKNKKRNRHVTQRWCSATWPKELMTFCSCLFSFITVIPTNERRHRIEVERKERKEKVMMRKVLLRTLPPYSKARTLLLVPFWMWKLLQKKSSIELEIILFKKLFEKKINLKALKYLKKPFSEIQRNWTKVQDALFCHFSIFHSMQHNTNYVDSKLYGFFKKRWHWLG